MAKLPNEPSIRELLEKSIALETHNAKLAARVEDLEKRATSNDKHLLRLIKQVGGILDDGTIFDAQIWELMEKVFPGHKRTQWQILNAFNRPKRTDPQEEGQPG